MRKRLAIPALCAFVLVAIGVPQASADFGLSDLKINFANQDGSAATQAGSHPFAVDVDIAVNTTEDEGFEVPDENARDILTQLPPGLLANPTATPRCSEAQFAAPGKALPECPDASVIGVFELTYGFGAPSEIRLSVYNLIPPPGKAIRFGFRPLGVPVVVDGGINPHPPYNGFAESLNISQAAFFYRGDLSIWGNPSSSLHDADRGICGFVKGDGDICPVSIPEKPFLFLPRSCTGPLTSEVKARSWQKPDRWVKYFPPAAGMSGCSKSLAGFAPTIDAKLSTDEAESPSGLAFDLDVNDPGIANPDGIVASDIKKSVVTLPEGVTANPSLAEGVVGCSEADLDRESASSAPGQGCPDASKIGTVEVETPLLEGEILKGGLYVAEPFKNPFHTLIALYMTIKSPERGINIVLEGKVEPDPRTGQLIATFDDLPQAPVSHFRLRFREGGRSPLISPALCGEYQTKAVLTPWADPSTSHTTTSTLQITGGVGGGPCPSGSQPFEPGFAAGSQNNAAGAYTPFAMRLTRRDGDQDLTRFDAILPPGVVAKLKGVSQCSDAQIAQLKAKSGKEELASPSCPASAKIGTVKAGAGVGSQLTYVPGSVYLAGPFAGAPLSVVGVVPAVAGPFDVGVVSTRQALTLNPVTGEVEVDGARSEPIPHILAGIPLRVRDIQVYVDRSQFTLNPTACDPFATDASIWGGGQNAFSLKDDSPVGRSARFQAADCASLGFKPRLSFDLKGGTKRGDNPAFKAVLRPRPGDANLKRTVVRFPRATFLDQGHIRTICTRVQFASDSCPPGSIYGKVIATTPLLEQPLRGPVYLRSSNNLLPDIVFDLKGIVEIEAAARADSVKGQLRVSFPAVPDAPVSKVVVEMQGARKGLLVNSTDVCAAKPKAKVALGAHNGKAAKLRPLMRAAGCAGKAGR
jgi:hypothetical protein